MKRRNLLIGLAAVGAAPVVSSRDGNPAFGSPSAQGASTAPRKKKKNGLKITDVEIWRLEGKRQSVQGKFGQRQVQPLHIYPEHRPDNPFIQSETVKTVTVGASANYLVIRAGDAAEGIYGPVDTEAAVVVHRNLRKFLVGKDPLAGETLWDKMFRLNRHSRASHYMMGISAVDNALWDLRGRYYGAPVYRLLGGPTREKVQAYGSALGSSVEPVAARRRAKELKEKGFRHQKWFLAYGPGDGAAGLKKNVELVRNLREAVGDEVDLMFDAFMGWDLQYAIAWAKQVEQYRPRWIEEAVHPSKIESFAELRKKTSIPVATGEHFYGRWEVKQFLEARAVNVIQADPEWCGGVSELVKICTLASAFDAHVVPHGHNLHAALHVIASQSPMTCPLLEYLVRKMEGYYHFEKHQLTPVDGFIDLPDRPGFGIELDDSKVEKKRLLTWD